MKTLVLAAAVALGQCAVAQTVSKTQVVLRVLFFIIMTLIGLGSS
jgi:hypothetical protein